MATDYAILFPSTHVTAADLGGKEITVEIERYSKGEDVVSPTGQKSKKPVLYFKRGTKGWVLNKTNAVAIARALNERDMDKWIGKKITLQPATCKAFGEDNVPCIRVKRD